MSAATGMLATSAAEQVRPLPSEREWLPFVSAAELRERAPAQPDWIWHDYLARCALTLLAAKPKAGKSTFAAALSEAVACEALDFHAWGWRSDILARSRLERRQDSPQRRDHRLTR